MITQLAIEREDKFPPMQRYAAKLDLLPYVRPETTGRSGLRLLEIWHKLEVDPTKSLLIGSHPGSDINAAFLYSTGEPGY